MDMSMNDELEITGKEVAVVYDRLRKTTIPGLENAIENHGSRTWGQESNVGPSNTEY
jgi:hypothetical protein